MNRVRYLDLYRYLTVSFAIASHAILSHGLILKLEPSAGLFLKSLTRTATPSLIVLFGMMVEIVYARKWDADRSSTLGALWHRVLLCYLCFVGLALVEFAVRDGGLIRLAGSVTLVLAVWNGTIFKLYMFLLAIVPLFLLVRNRYGATGLVIVPLAIFLFHLAALDPLPPLPKVGRHLGGLLFGIGDTFGPSVIHASALIVFGMLLGAVVTGRATPQAKAGFAIMLCGSVGVLGYYIAAQGFMTSLNNVADYSQWRSQNHPAYFAFGMVVSVAILAFSYFVTLAVPQVLVRIPETVGGATLIYFFLGNVLIGFGYLLGLNTIPQISAVIASYIVLSTVAVVLWLKYAKPSRVIVGFNDRSVSILTHAWMGAGRRWHGLGGAVRRAD